MNRNDEKVYFAMEPSDRIGSKLVEKVEQFYQSMENASMLDNIYASLRCYYGGPFGSTGGNSKRIERGGKYGQLSKMRVNHVRNLGLHILQLATSQKPTPQPVAGAGPSDSKTQEAVTLSKGILDYYSRFKRVDKLLRSACERAIVTGEAFVDVNWDADLGDVEATDGVNVKKAGDLDFTVLSALEVIREISPGHDGIGDWVIMCKPANRYDMLAKYGSADAEVEALPEDAAKRLADVTDAILSAPKISFEGRFRNRRPWGAVIANTVSSSDDCIAMFEFRHAKTPACPEGRLIKMTEDGTVFLDSKLPFDDLNVRRLVAGEMMDTPFAYSPLFDLLGIQEVIDALYSAVASNQMTFATQLIWALKSADFDYRQLSHGISLLEGNDPHAKPEPLNLTSTPAEVFKFIEQLEHVMETISGINATVRGNPEYSLKSGSALALIQSQAIQFASTLQESYAHLVEDVYTDMLSLLQLHADSERQVVITGKFNRSYIASFKSDDLRGVKRVVVDVGPAVGQTLAYRTEVARDLLSAGVIKKPEEYLAVVNTGRLEPLIEGDNAELMLIQKENEFLKEGKPVYALPIDRHLLHITEHRCAIADPEARMDPARVKAISDHVMEHMQFLADPSFAPLMMVLGETPLAAVMAGGQPAGSPQDKGPQPNAKSGQPEGAPPGPTEPQNQQPSQPRQPKMPSPAKPPNGGSQDTSV